MMSNRQVCKHCGEPIEMISITTLWQSNEDGHTIEIRNMADKLCLVVDGKTVMKYYDKSEQWVGVHNGKIVRINWSGLTGLFGEYKLATGEFK